MIRSTFLLAELWCQYRER